MKTLSRRLTALVLTAALCFSLAACSFGGSGGKENEDPKVGEATTFVKIDINPSIELTLDENGLVASIYGANDDGVVLLYGEEENLLGKDYETAAAYITDLAADLGYITEGHEISTSVLAGTDEAAAAIKAKLDGKITATAEAIGISVTLSADEAYALLRDLKELKEKYPDSTAIQGLTPDKYKLVISASENGDIEISAAAEMSNEELIGKINEAHTTIKGYATDLYKEAKARAEMIYELAMGVALDGVYNAVYMQRIPAMLTNPSYKDTFYYGAVYQAYMTTARTFDALEDIMEFGEEMTNYELDAETVSAIAAELGIEDTTVFENSEGKVTVESVVDYVEKFLDEHELSEEIEDRVEELLDEAEDAAEMAALASDAYAADLTALKTQIEAIVTTVNSTATPVLPFLSADAKAELEACLEDLNSTVVNIGTMMEGGLTEEELEALAEDAEEKAEEMLEKIKADLSEEELAAAEELKRQAEETVTRLTSEFSQRLTAAETEAKAEIERRRAERSATADDVTE